MTWSEAERVSASSVAKFGRSALNASMKSVWADEPVFDRSFDLRVI